MIPRWDHEEHARALVQRPTGMIPQTVGYHLPQAHRRFMQAVQDMGPVGPQGQMGVGEERGNHRGSLYAHPSRDGGHVFFSIETIGDDGRGSMSPEEAERTGWALIAAAHEAAHGDPESRASRDRPTSGDAS